MKVWKEDGGSIQAAGAQSAMPKKAKKAVVKRSVYCMVMERFLKGAAVRDCRKPVAGIQITNCILSAGRRTVEDSNVTENHDNASLFIAIADLRLQIAKQLEETDAILQSHVIPAPFVTL